MKRNEIDITEFLFSVKKGKKMKQKTYIFCNHCGRQLVVYIAANGFHYCNDDCRQMKDKTIEGSPPEQFENPKPLIPPHRRD